MRNAWIAAPLVASLLVGAAREVRAAVDVERHGNENPVLEVAKSTIYGGLAGLVVGLALTWAADTDDDDITRWSFAAGTIVGLGAGIYFVSHRPAPTAMLHLQDGDVTLRPPVPEMRPDGSLQVRVASFSF